MSWGADRAPVPFEPAGEDFQRSCRTLFGRTSTICPVEANPDSAKRVPDTSISVMSEVEKSGRSASRHRLLHSSTAVRPDFSTTLVPRFGRNDNDARPEQAPGSLPEALGPIRLADFFVVISALCKTARSTFPKREENSAVFLLGRYRI